MTLHVAHRTIPGYGAMRDIVPGEVFELLGLANDEVMVRVNLVGPVPPNARPVQCGRCGRHFLDAPSLDRHGRRAHDEAGPATSDMTPAAARKILAQLPRTEVIKDEDLPAAVASMTMAQQVVASEEAAERAADAELESLYPIHLDKTAASKAAGVGGIDETNAPSLARRGGKGRKRKARRTRGGA